MLTRPPSRPRATAKDGTKSRPGTEDADRKREEPPADAAERERLDKLAAAKREYRILIEDGGAVLDGVRVRDINSLTEALLDLHWLPEDRSEDRKAICAAIGALLDDIASRHRPMS